MQDTVYGVCTQMNGMPVMYTDYAMLCMQTYHNNYTNYGEQYGTSNAGTHSCYKGGVNGSILGSYSTGAILPS